MTAGHGRSPSETRVSIVTDRRRRRLPPATPVVTLVTLVVTLTLVMGGRGGALAASPTAVAHGRLWLLLVSGLVAEHPIGASLVSFALLAALTYSVCGARAFALSAVVGHVGSTLLAYGFIGLARLVAPHAFQALLTSPDYGVSAVSAAWLGALTQTGWRARGQTLQGRASLALGCLAIGVFAYMLRPGLSVLASEHVFAFALGAAMAGLVSPRRSDPKMRSAAADALAVATKLYEARPRWLVLTLQKVDPFALAALLLTLVLVGGSVAPSAIGALYRNLVSEPRFTIARCIEAWNREPPSLSLPGAVRVEVGRASLATPRRRQARDTCTVRTLQEGEEVVFTGTWAHGRILSWSTGIVRRPVAAAENLTQNAIYTLAWWPHLEERTRGSDDAGHTRLP